MLITLDFEVGWGALLVGLSREQDRAGVFGLG